MISLKKQKGFTIVELLIVIVVIGILATLVIVTFTGIQQKARDSKRKTDIGALDAQLEAYYADANHGYYPTLANLQDSSWVAANLKGLDPTGLVDPKGGTIAATTSASNYGYAVLPAGCDNSATMCTSFTVSATLESDGSTFSKQSNT